MPVAEVIHVRVMAGGIGEIYYAKIRRGGMGTGMPHWGRGRDLEHRGLSVDFLVQGYRRGGVTMMGEGVLTEPYPLRSGDLRRLCCLQNNNHC